MCQLSIYRMREIEEESRERIYFDRVFILYTIYFLVGWNRSSALLLHPFRLYFRFDCVTTTSGLRVSMCIFLCCCSLFPSFLLHSPCVCVCQFLLFFFTRSWAQEPSLNDRRRVSFSRPRISSFFLMGKEIFVFLSFSFRSIYIHTNVGKAFYYF